MTESARPFLVVSDVHIGAIDPAHERAFHRFVAHAAENASGLLINGDLFDLWVPSRRFVDRRFVRTLGALAAAVDAGLPVYFVGGNHDAPEYGPDAVLEDIGVRLLDDPTHINIAGREVLVVHGDGVRAGRAEYVKEHPALRALLRTGGVWRLIDRLMPSDQLHRVASPISRTPRFAARARRGEGTGPKPAAEPIEQWVRARMAEEPQVAVVFAGHSHLPALEEIEPGRFYVNTGDWIEHLTYAEINIGSPAPALRRWNA